MTDPTPTAEVVLKPSLTEEVKDAAKVAFETLVRMARFSDEPKQLAAIAAIHALVDAL